MTIRTRFAPSPTGYLHIGGVRTAMYNWLLARQSGGQFVLRIDDTDAQRNVAEALKPILQGFRWLGLDWDEGPEVDGPFAPYYQSQRGDRYAQAVARLLESGAAYRDYATSDEYQSERQAAEKDKRPFVYSRRWMAETELQAREFERTGRAAVVRLKMPREGKCEFVDLVRGPMSFEWSLEADHVIQRADGSCLYNLATVVDDIEMQITHVVRSIEHLSNTPRQIFIFRALGADLPEFAHLPYVAEPGSQNKLSKRKIANYLKNPDFKRLYDDGWAIACKLGIEANPESFNPVLIEFYESVGYLPQALLNYLLLLGWSLDDKTEHFDRSDMLQHFSLERVIKSPASFDPQKLTAFEARHFAALSVAEKTDRVIPFLQRVGWIDSPITGCSDAAAIGSSTRDFLRRLVAAIDQRLVVAGDILLYEEFFVSDERLSIDQETLDKRVRQSSEAGHLLNEFKKYLVASPDFSAASLETVMNAFTAQFAIKPGQIVLALRLALTGKPKGIGIYETLELLGRDRCIRRIDLLLERLSRQATPPAQT